MTQVTHSITMIAPVDDAPAFNAYGAGLNWGENTLTVPLSADGQLPVTHLGAHDMRTGEWAATLMAAKESDDPELDALDPVFIYPVESDTQKFDEALQSSEIVAALGTTLQRYYPPVEM